MRGSFIQFMLWVAMLFFVVSWCQCLSGCAGQELDQALDTAADFVEGYIEVHRAIDSNVDVLRDACTDLQEATTGTPLYTKVNNACKAGERILNTIRKVDERLLMKGKQ